MSEKEQIKSMVKEAEIYRTQGLFDQSKEKHPNCLKTFKTLLVNYFHLQRIKTQQPSRELWRWLNLASMKRL